MLLLADHRAWNYTSGTIQNQNILLKYTGYESTKEKVLFQEQTCR